MKRFTQSLTITGIVTSADAGGTTFVVQCQSGDKFTVAVQQATEFRTLCNLDGSSTDRIPSPAGYSGSPSDRLKKYVVVNRLVVVEGVHQLDGATEAFDARVVHLLSDQADRYYFEDTHWWLSQTKHLADRWLDSLFGDTRNYDLDDFLKFYRTNLNILGLPVDDDIQECAVLSRLIYGLASAYLLLGDERYRRAASAGVKFQRDAFRTLSHDGRHCFWAHGRRRTRYGTTVVFAAEDGDDGGSVPLYEQIYALAGLAQYYRISRDPEVLVDLDRSMRTFNAFYLDAARPSDSAFQGRDGWFSHIDAVSMRPDQNPNAINDLRKNWNSVGDHIPAYLINVILALEPDSEPPALGHHDTLVLAREMLERSVCLILEKFQDPDPAVPFVDERFFADWTPDHAYSWQQNRAIVGHNFKIAWNLTRAANYFDTRAAAADRRADGATVQHFRGLATRCTQMAERLTRAMTTVGIDQIRGGCFDALERRPAAGRPVQFAWSNTKDFWQQEQAILAYLITFGRLHDVELLEMARRCQGFWNVFFLDADHSGIFFRVTDNGVPIEDRAYGVRGGHSDASGYHCFELAYLAHVYQRLYVAPVSRTDGSFCLYFRPDETSGVRTLNVMPDFIAPGRIRITRVRVNGVARAHEPSRFEIELGPHDLGAEIAVEFAASKEMRTS